MSEYTRDEMMTVAAARLLRDGQVCFVGIGLPSAACNLARLTHAPELVLIYESGTIGRRPTVNPVPLPLLEVHLFDWDGDLYGAHLRVRFLKKLRDEKKFDGIEALKAAIARDAREAREYFDNHG